MQEIHVVVFKGVVVLSGIPMKPGSPNRGSGCTSSDSWIPALSRRVLEILRGRSHGHFCPKGHYSAGTVRG